jgi:ParB family chromosome partitioning protein
MHNIQIDSEFQALIPPLSAEERAQLEANIVADGCRDPLVVWGGVLIDGHNRYEICTRLGLVFDVVPKEFIDRDAARLWICKNQLGRRNLTDFQRVELALAMKPIVQAKAAEQQARKPDSVSQNSDEQKPMRTDDAVAEIAGVSRDTVRKVEKIQSSAAPAIIEAARTGGLSTHMAAQLADMPREEQDVVAAAPADSIKQVAREVVKAHVANNSGNNEWYTPADYIELARQVMGGIDTDPASSSIANQTVKAAQIFTADDNGLTQTWTGRVWMNPPYAQPLIADFADAVASKYESGEINEACVLVNNGTETAWFQRILKTASAVCFPRSRIRFIDQAGNPSGAPLQGQAVLYLGKGREEFADVFATKGAVLFNG